MHMNRSMMRWVVLGAILLSLTAMSFGQIAVGVSVRFGPPALPVYAQPICPGPGYMWTPGYWAWGDDDGYYWVPGTWVMAPVGMLWTPGWWGWGGGVYLWHPGYWGPHVGFYGGINYGFGYGGVGFAGGEWRGNSFYYNRYVTNVSVTNVTNVYNRTVIVNENHVAFNGGRGGVMARPTAREEEYGREHHMEPLQAQVEHRNMAMRDRSNFASENHGRPAIAATSRAGDFSRHSVVAARNAGGEYHPPAMSPREARVNTPNRSNEVRSNDGFRSFSQPNRNNNSTANERNNNAGRNENRSNDGYRSFTPPNRNNNSMGNDRSSNNNAGRNENRSNDQFRSFNPPNGNNKSMSNERNNNNVRGNEGRFNDSRPNESRPQNNMRSNESRPQNNMRSNENRPQNNVRESQPRQNSQRESRPAPAPRHQGPPPKEERRR